ncbi:MAG: hypothetical protein ACHQ0Y_05505 [Thermodesulfovibrionales bacterium]
MTKTTIPRITMTVFLIAVSFVFVSAAMAVTENECINGGGSTAVGSGCKFCVGGKFDLSEIKETGKNDAGRPATDQKTTDKTSTKSGAGTVKTPADH